MDAFLAVLNRICLLYRKDWDEGKPLNTEWSFIILGALLMKVFGGINVASKNVPNALGFCWYL